MTCERGNLHRVRPGEWRTRPNADGGECHELMLAVRPGAPGRSGAPSPYGVVVESVNVSDLLYAPVRSASVAATGCLNRSVTGSLLTGAA